MEQTNSEIIIIITSTVIVLFITVGLILLFSVFQKRKNELLIEQERAKEDFEREITESQI
jgi:flagellar basal body-associated protein FliL